MKTSIYLSILVIILFFSCKNNIFTFNYQMNEKDTGIYYVDLPDGLDTMRFDATIRIDQSKEIHQIKFPNGGSGTTVLIYDSTYLQKIQKNNNKEQQPLVKSSFNHEQNVLLNITELKQGKYYVHYLSCSLGGIFPLTIK